MDAIVLIAAWLLYLFAGYSAVVLGFFDALLTLARPRLGFAIYWGARLLEAVAIYYIVHDYAWVIGYALGFSAGWAYRPSYSDGAERTGARSWRWFRRLRVWRLLHWWVCFSPSCEIVNRYGDPELFAVHPHGFIPIGVTLQFLLPGRQGHILRPRDHDLLGPNLDPLVAVTSIIFWIPIVREFCLWVGCVIADRDVMIAVLKKRSLVVLPGGVGEMVTHDHDKLVMKFDHFGFLEIAKAAYKGYVPVFAQGENRAWIVLPGSRTFRRLMAHLIGWPFPTLPVPFLFPVDISMHAKGPVRVEDLFKYDARDKSVTRKEHFVNDMRALVEAHECSEDIDLSCFVCK